MRVYCSPRLGARLAAAVIVAVLGGCASDPVYLDPLAGLAKVPAASVPQDVPVTVDQPVALVPSENSAKVLDLAAEFAASANGALVKSLVSDKLWADGDPQQLVDGAVGVLRRRYPKIELVDDLATARQRGFHTTFVVDIQYHHLVTAFDTNHVTITLVVMDARETPVSRIVAEGKSGTTYGSMDAHFRDAAAMSVATLDAKATQFLRDSGNP
ncbi:MAG TPA: hypothetical protein VN802_10340 [Stellaceae bacterium]|nr:hypothetical protein [Stellaceae bacterium]